MRLATPSPTRHFSLWCCLLALPLSACTGPGWHRSQILTSAGLRTVETEQYTAGGEPQDQGFAHPQQVSAGAIAQSLMQIQFRRQQGESQYLMDADTAAALGQTWASAFARLSPSERIRFKLERQREVVWLLRATNVTRGVAFLTGPRQLNIVFDLIDEAQDPDNPETWGNPTSVTESVGVSILGGPDMTVARGGSGHRHWLVINLPETQSVGPVEDVPVSAGELAQDETPPTTVPMDSSDTFEQLRREIRRQYLQELYEQGVISDADYQLLQQQDDG